MSSPKSNIKEDVRKTLEKHIKYFILSCSQIVIQSRCGSKLNTRAKKNRVDVLNWFNLTLQEMPDLKEETEHVYQGMEDLSLKTFCIEMLLTTAEQEDFLLLETFCVNISNRPCEINCETTTNLFEHLSTLLKSLICITRTLPGYTISRQQGPDSFIFCYRIYIDEPDLHGLGNDYVVQPIGSVNTAIGTINLKVLYRQKIQFSPTQTTSCEVMNGFKMNHFDDDANVITKNYGNCKIVQPLMYLEKCQQSTEKSMQNETKMEISNGSNGSNHIESINLNGSDGPSHPLENFVIVEPPNGFCDYSKEQDKVPSLDDLPFISLINHNTPKKKSSVSKLSFSGLKKKLSPPSSPKSLSSTSSTSSNSVKNSLKESALLNKIRSSENDDMINFYRTFMEPATLQCQSELGSNGFIVKSDDQEQQFAFEEEETKIPKDLNSNEKRTIEDFEREAPVFDEFIEMLEQKVKECKCN